MSATVVFWQPICLNRRSATTRILSRVSVSMCSEISVMSALNVQLFCGVGKRNCVRALGVMLRRKIRLLGLATFVQALPEPQGVKTRQVQQGQEGRNKQTAHDGNRHRAPEGRT